MPALLLALAGRLGWRVWAILGAVVAVAAAVVAIYHAGATAQRDAQRVETLESALERSRTRHDVEDEIRRRPGGGTAADRLRDEWSRGD